MQSVSIKPTFLVIGAAKCGTTSLCVMLNAHPQVYMCKPKEPRFFSNDENYYSKGWEWYSSLFRESAHCQARGEGSVHYTTHDAFPKAATRIAKDLPEAKLIYMVRDPLERCRSQWQQEVREYTNTPPFAKMIRDGLKDGVMALRSKYWWQLSAYRDHFPDEQILVWFIEDFACDHQVQLKRCYEFLGVDQDFCSKQANLHLKRASSYVEPTTLLKIVKRVPLIPDLAWRFAPNTVRRVAKSTMLKRPIAEKPKWDADIRQILIDKLYDDSMTFLQYCGKPPDFWDFSL
jgi:hypothetical protein